MRIRLVLALAALALSAPTPARESPEGPAPFRVVGYLPDYRAAAFDLGAARGLTDLVLFSAEPTAEGGLDLARLKAVPWAELRAFKTRQRVRLILCVGGWERSAHFPAVAASAPRRAAFVAAAVKLCLAERLDGVDLDWEHPATDAEQAGHGALLAELRAAFGPHGLALSVTVAAWQRLVPAAIVAVDSVNLMAYDHPGRHSTFDGAKSDVDALLAAGVPAGKVVLGVPFYGRALDKSRRAVAYRDLAAGKLPPGADEAGGVAFNGPDTVRRKAEFALRSKLGGVMVWELGQDAPGDASLLGAVRAVVGGK